MRFINSLLVAGAAFASMATAAISFTSVPTAVQVGTPVTLKWQTDDSAAPVTIILKYGPSSNLGTVKTLTANGKNGEFTWTPEKTDGNGNLYAFEIEQAGEINYSGQFTLTGGSPNAPTVSGTLSASASSASATDSSSSASASSASKSASTLSTATITGSSSTDTASATAKSTGSASSSASATTSASKSASSTASAMSVPSSTGAAVANYAGSPVALVFGAFAAMAYLN